MKRHFYFFRVCAAILFGLIYATGSESQTLLIENFNYASGSLLTNNGWSAHSGPGNNPVAVGSPGLVFTGYPSSDIGLAALLVNDGEDVNKSFTPVTSGNIYCAFLVKAGSVINDYFLHLSNSSVSTNKARVYIKGSGTTFNFGLSKGSETTTFTTGASYTTGTTYLLVIKYSVLEGSNNDNVSLFIITGSVPASEPSLPSIGPLNDASQTDLANISAVALRQYSSSQNIIIDGIRVAQNWESVVGITTDIHDFNSNIHPLIYPVPASEYLTVSNIDNITGMEVLDFAGRRLITIKTGFCEKIIIPISELCSGFYLLKLESTEESKIIKFIKR